MSAGLSFFLSMYMYSLFITLTFTVVRALAETTHNLYYQSLIDLIDVCNYINMVNMSNIGVLGLSLKKLTTLGRRIVNRL